MKAIRIEFTVLQADVEFARIKISRSRTDYMVTNHLQSLLTAVDGDKVVAPAVLDEFQFVEKENQLRRCSKNADVSYLA